MHIIREVAATFAKPVMLFSGGKDSVVMLHLAAKAFWPAPIPFGLLHVDTGHNFPEVLEYRDQAAAVLRRRARGGAGPGLHRRRPAPGAAGRPAQPAADGAAAGCDHRRQARRRLRRRAPGRGAGPGQGAGLQHARRVRAVGPAQPAPGAVVAVQRPAPAGRARPGVPAVQLDRARRLGLHRGREDRPAVDLLRPRARGDAAGRHVGRRHPGHAGAGGRGGASCARCATARSATCPARPPCCRPPAPCTT